MPKTTDKTGALLRIRSCYPQFTQKEREVADYVLENATALTHRTISQAVKDSGASYGSLDRFCKKLGYSGFQDLKIHLAEDMAMRRLRQVDTDPDRFLAQSTQIALQDIHNTAQLLSEQAVTTAARAIAGAEFVLVAGVSSSGGTAMGVDYRMARYGIRSCCHIDGHMQRHRAASLTARDVAVLISISGSTREILSTGQIANEAGATLVGITNYNESPLTELCDVSLITGLECDPLGSEIVSRVALEFLITVLFDRIEDIRKNSRQMLAETFEATADLQL